MRRSGLVDVVLIAALLVGATALLGLIRGLPGACPKPGPSSVEALFAPCLATSREDMSRADLAGLDVLPPPPVRPGAAIAVAPPEQQRPALDVDVTGSVTRGQR